MLSLNCLALYCTRPYFRGRDISVSSECNLSALFVSSRVRLQVIVEQSERAVLTISNVRLYCTVSLHCTALTHYLYCTQCTSYTHVLYVQYSTRTRACVCLVLSSLQFPRRLFASPFAVFLFISASAAASFPNHRPRDHVCMTTLTRDVLTLPSPLLPLDNCAHSALPVMFTLQLQPLSNSRPADRLSTTFSNAAHRGSINEQLITLIVIFGSTPLLLFIYFEYTSIYFGYVNDLFILIQQLLLFILCSFSWRDVLWYDVAARGGHSVPAGAHHPVLRSGKAQIWIRYSLHRQHYLRLRHIHYLF